MQLLTGVRVLDFGRYIAGPFAAALLGDLGADVIRIERVGGGEDRFVGPVAPDGSGPMFLQVNRGKRSVTLDPTSDDGREVVRRLVPTADVVVANLPLRGLEAMGLDEPSLRALRPDVVLTAVSAFGWEGPDADRVGFDGIAQVMSGGAYLTGRPGDPTKFYSPWVDFLTATNAAFGTLAALWHRERTGEGQVVEGALTRSALGVTNFLLSEQEQLGLDRVPEGSRTQTAAPADVFPTSDGAVIVQVVGDPLFARVARLLGHEEWIGDPRYTGDDARADRRDELGAVMGRWCAARTTEEAIAELNAARVPAGPVLTPQQALEDPHAEAAGWWRHHDYPGMATAARVMGFPVRLSADDPAVDRRAPTVGEHTDEVLTEIGYGPEEIERLRADGVV
jgi:crotonobetainyl-CoA:carnitine CoA-transferase CaiB-like acyl-CoA transferase